MKLLRTSPCGGRGERGSVLIGVIVLATILVIAFAAYLPSIATQIRRDREEELIRRGRQYTRAIQLYYRKWGRYPGTIEQLEETNNIRFLRKKYKDPITGKDEWKLIRFGQARVSTRGLRGASGLGTPAGAAGNTGTAGTAKTGAGGQSGGLGTPAESISKPLSGSSTLGGGPIVGVASTSKKESIKELDGRNKYDEWEFVYDPSQDPNARAQQGSPQSPQGGRPQPGTPNQPGQPTLQRPTDRR